MSTAILVGVGQKLYGIVLPLIVYDMTGSSEFMGIMRAVEFLPNLLFALFIGVWIERFNKKYWSFFSLFLQGICLVLAYFLAVSGHSYMYALFLIIFIVSTCSYCYYISQMIILKSSVSKDNINLATARLSSVNNFFDAIGPAFSGVALLFFSIYYPLLGISFLFILAAFFISRLDWREEVVYEKKPMIASIVESWQLLKEYKNLYYLSWLIMFLNVFGGMFEIQMLFLVIDQFQFKSHQIGFLFSLAGMGAFVGAFFAPYIRKSFGLGRTLLLTAFLEGSMFLFFALLKTEVSLYVSFFISTMMGMITSICIWSYRSEIVDVKYLGRIAGITGSIFKIGLPLGLATSGYLASLAGSFNFLLFCGVLQILIVAFYCNKVTLSIK